MKYSKKIESFLSDIKPSIRLGSISHKSKAVQKIYESVKSSVEKNRQIKILEQSVLKPIHDKEQYPLSYIFFRCLKELNLMDQILPLTPDISDFRTFVDWHRENIESINFDKVHSLMENLNKDIDLTDQDGSDDLTDTLIDVYRTIHKTSGHRKILHDALYENKFISWDVQHDLESSTLKYTKYMINDKHTVCVFVPVPDSIADMGRVDETTITMDPNVSNKVENETCGPDIETIAMLIDTMENLVRSDRGSVALPVNLTVMFSNQKKNVYPKTKVLCCDNINSGSTYPGRSIVCWRREEFYKVLIHELFHYHSFDFFSSNPYYKKLDDMLILPKIEGSDMLNEAYTETSTIIILSIVQYVNDMYLSDKIVPILDTDLTDHMSQFLNKEIMFILFQIAKILVIFGCDDVDLYINNKIMIHQNTSFRSYFIIKMLLLSNITDTLQMMDRGLTLDDQRLIEFGELINRSWKYLLQDEIRLELINTFIEKIKSAYVSQSTDTSWIYKTCRMSVDDMIQNVSS